MKNIVHRLSKWLKTPPKASDAFGVNIRESYQALTKKWIYELPDPMQSGIDKLRKAASNGTGCKLTEDEARTLYLNLIILLR